MSEDEKETAKDPIQEHRQMAMFSENISDFQIKNMKIWLGLLFDKNLRDSEIKYDFTGVSASMGVRRGSINYSIKLKEIPDNLEELEEKLYEWTKFLFWKDLAINIKVELYDK